MRSHLTSLLIGTSLLAAGLVLRFALADADLPLVSAAALGLVLIALGALEVVVSGVLVLLPRTRHVERPL